MHHVYCHTFSILKSFVSLQNAILYGMFLKTQNSSIISKIFFKLKIEVTDKKLGKKVLNKKKKITYRIHITGHNSIAVNATFIILCQPIIEYHNTIIMIVTLRLMYQPFLYYSASHSYTIAACSTYTSYTIDLFHQPTLYYCVTHSYAIVPTFLTLFCQSFFSYCISHIYTIVLVILILLFQSLLLYCTSHSYSFVAVTHLLLY